MGSTDLLGEETQAPDWTRLLTSHCDWSWSTPLSASFVLCCSPSSDTLIHWLISCLSTTAAPQLPTNDSEVLLDCVSLITGGKKKILLHPLYIHLLGFFNLTISKWCAKTWAFLFFHSIILWLLMTIPGNTVEHADPQEKARWPTDSIGKPCKHQYNVSLWSADKLYDIKNKDTFKVVWREPKWGHIYTLSLFWICLEAKALVLFVSFL